MSLDVNRLRRRSPGKRLLIALDQSTLSDLVLQPELAGTRALLEGGAEAGQLVCPMSPGADDETRGAGDLWRDISDLHEALSMGIEFLDPKSIREREAFAAAAAFTAAPPLYSVTEEAFDRDPHLPRDELFAGGFRIVARIGPNELQSDEVARNKDKEATLQRAYENARASGASFEEQALGEYEAMVRWVLGPLADENFAAEYERKKAAAVVALATGDWNGIRQWQAVSQRGEFAEALAEHFPAIADHTHDFARSSELANMPSLRYPALLRAGIAVRVGRRAKRGDGYDIDHLTTGLARCDIVTADASMAQLARDYKLIPTDCRLFSSREMPAFHTAVERALADPRVAPSD